MTSSGSGRRIVSIVKYDSYISFAAVIALWAGQQGYDFELWVVHEDNQPPVTIRQIAEFTEAYPVSVVEKMSAFRSVKKQDLSDLSLYDGIDLLAIGIGGPELWHLLVRISDLSFNKRPVLVSGYPGIPYFRRWRGLLMRARSDIILCHSPRLLRNYKLLCWFYGFSPNNMLLFKFPTLLLPPKRQRNPIWPPEEITFFEQISIPGPQPERQKLYEGLTGLAKQFPNITFRIKPRHDAGERTSHHNIDAITIRSIEELPPNLVIWPHSMNGALAVTDLVVSVTSTATLEALSCDIPSAVISDFSYQQRYGDRFFKGSGLQFTLAELAGALKTEEPWQVDRDWFTDNLHPCTSQECLEALNTRIDGLWNARDQNSANDPVVTTRRGKWANKAIRTYLRYRR